MAKVFSVELRGVSKSFGDVVAVDNINLQVNKGEFFSILGPSGCGKTTTLRLIAGLENPDEGDILINGQRVNHIPPYERDVNTVFQRLALFPHLTVEENIAFGLKLQKMPRQEIQRTVEAALELVQLVGLGRRFPEQLSGGQQQRVALARALVLQPEVLLLDEPLASLDRKLRVEMRKELRRIQEEVGITFIYVTHDQKEAMSMSDRVAVMKDGKLVQIGTPHEIYEEPKTKFVADFMGFSNLFSGRVTCCNPAEVQMETDKGLKICLPAENSLATGAQLTVSIRPEEIEVLPKDAAWAVGPQPQREQEDNYYLGKIEDAIYLGDVTELLITLPGGHQLTAHVPNRAGLSRNSFAEGDEVLVGWKREVCRVLTD